MSFKWITVCLALAAIVQLSCGLPTFAFPEGNNQNLQDAAGPRTQSRDSRFEIPRENSEQEQSVKKDSTQQLHDGGQDSIGPHKQEAQQAQGGVNSMGPHKDSAEQTRMGVDSMGPEKESKPDSRASVDAMEAQNDSPQQASEGVDMTGPHHRHNSGINHADSKSKLPTQQEGRSEDRQRNKEQQEKAGAKSSKAKGKLGDQKSAQPSGQGELKRSKRFLIPGPRPFLPGPFMSGPFMPGPIMAGPMPYPVGRIGIAVPAPFPGVVAGPFMGPPIGGGIGVGIAGPFFP